MADQNRTLQADLPEGVMREMQSMVDAGWFRSTDELVLDALRRFLDSHRGDLMQDLIREDVEWGLHGSD